MHVITTNNLSETVSLCAGSLSGCAYREGRHWGQLMYGFLPFPGVRSADPQAKPFGDFPGEI
jgi:hypothetical protein